MTKTKEEIQELIDSVEDEMQHHLEAINFHAPNANQNIYGVLENCKTALQESIQLEKDYCDLMSMYNELLNSDEKKCYNELEQLKYEYKKVMDRVGNSEVICGLIYDVIKREGCVNQGAITKAIQNYIRGKDD